jgi:integrase
VTSHDFRKTRATNLHKYDGWSILQIAAYLGHADVKTTQAYIEIEPELGYEYLVDQ